MNNEEWLESLKVGCDVAIQTQHGFSKAKVIRITKTMIVTEGRQIQRRWNRRTGSPTGPYDVWDYLYLSPITKEMEEEWKREQVIKYLDYVNFDVLSTAYLEQIKSLVLKALPEGEPK